LTVYAKLKAAGKCVRCARMKPEDWRGARCPECAEAHRKGNRRHQRRRAARCRKRWRTANERRRLMARLLKRCLDCGEKHDRNALRCSICTRDESDRSAQRRREAAEKVR
jgi:hypothetical protein